MPNNNIYFDTKTSFQHKLAQGIFIISLMFVLPIGIDHLLNERILYGLGCLGIAALFSSAAWLSIKKHAWFIPIIWTTVPAMSILLYLATKDLGLMILFWCYPTIIAYHFLLSIRQGIIANSIFLALMLPAAWSILESTIMIRFVLTLICVSGFAVFFIYYIKQQQQQLETLALTDSLTGLLNRTTLQQKLNHMVEQHARFGSEMTLVSIDLDYFKQINDDFGHDVGDEVLIGVSDYLKQRFRGVDLVFRTGGEEFLLLLFNCNIHSGKTLAEEIRKNIQTLPLIPNSVITASFGVADLLPQETQNDWLKRCDKKLYKAKELGRNQVVF